MIKGGSGGWFGFVEGDEIGDEGAEGDVASKEIAAAMTAESPSPGSVEWSIYKSVEALSWASEYRRILLRQPHSMARIFEARLAQSSCPSSNIRHQPNASFSRGWT